MERVCALAILGLSEPITKGALDARFRALAKQLHPDTGFSREAASSDAPLDCGDGMPTIETVIAARKVLAETLCKGCCDSSPCSGGCSGGCSGSCSGRRAAPNDAGDGHGGAEPGLDVEIPARIHLRISTEMTRNGGLFHVHYPGGECPECRGSGKTSPTKCLECLGDGAKEAATGFIRVRVECAACGGTGHLEAPPCSACRGRGNTEALRISVFVPRACENGELLEGTATPVSDKGKKVADLPIFVVTVLAA